MSVFLPYIGNRLNELVQRRDWGNRQLRLHRNARERMKYWLSRVLTILNHFMKIAAFVNILWFLVSHEGRNLVERVSGTEMEVVDKHQRRFISFLYISRQIVWGAIAHSLQQLLPFLDFSKVTGMFQISNKLT